MPLGTVRGLLEESNISLDSHGNLMASELLHQKRYHGEHRYPRAQGLAATCFKCRRWLNGSCQWSTALVGHAFFQVGLPFKMKELEAYLLVVQVKRSRGFHHLRRYASVLRAHPSPEPLNAKGLVV